MEDDSEMAFFFPSRSCSYEPLAQQAVFGEHQNEKKPGCSAEQHGSFIVFNPF